MIKALRTPEKNFENLYNFPFEPIYIENLQGYEGLRMHYIDEGPVDSKVVFYVYTVSQHGVIFIAG